MKMKPCSKGQPTKDDHYLAQLQFRDIDGDFINHYMVLPCCGGHWNCERSKVTGEVIRDSEINNIVAWCELPEFYTGEE